MAYEITFPIDKIPLAYFHFGYPFHSASFAYGPAEWKSRIFISIMYKHGLKCNTFSFHKNIFNKLVI